jgi:hypothetical protein
MLHQEKHVEHVHAHMALLHILKQSDLRSAQIM